MPAEDRGLLRDVHIRFCPNASWTGLTSKRMAHVLERLSVGVPEQAVSTWVSPKKPHTGRGHLDEWRKVSDPEGDRDEDEDAKVGDQFLAQVSQPQQDVPLQFDRCLGPHASEGSDVSWSGPLL